MNRPSKVYLGDSVYVEWDTGGLNLTTENGVSVSNTIYLEPDVYDNLVRYVEYIKQWVAEQRALPEDSKEQ